MDKYTIIAPKGRERFANRLGELYLTLSTYLEEEQSAGRHLQLTKVFLSDAQNQYDDLVTSTLYQSILSKAACSIIEQPPLDGSKITILVKTSDSSDNFILDSIRLSEEETRGANSYIQTMLIFNKYLDKMKEKGLTLKEHCVRTWIYVADIDVNYEGMVRARNDIFRNQGLTPETHFIASTGIGGFSQTRSASVAIDFLTYPEVKETDMKYLHALDNLNPTHEYGVSFERGTRLDLDGKQTIFISGTASIDKHGKAMYVGDIQRQTARLLENIGALLHDGGSTMRDVRYFLVYLRDPSDRELVEAFLSKAYPTTPHVLLQGKVCRPEWLVEMECVAVKEEQ
ncbi:MAG: translation initiation inhibitor [Prevotella sp.]|nr:translation initiation inhibitor [Prevotella sp.]